MLFKIVFCSKTPCLPPCFNFPHLSWTHIQLVHIYCLPPASEGKLHREQGFLPEVFTAAFSGVRAVLGTLPLLMPTLLPHQAPKYQNVLGPHPNRSPCSTSPSTHMPIQASVPTCSWFSL